MILYEHCLCWEFSSNSSGCEELPPSSELQKWLAQLPSCRLQASGMAKGFRQSNTEQI